jgi:transcriptional regulator with XRE-family HTH domain
MSEIFGDRLKSLRTNQKMSLKSLGEELDISVATLSNYERNDRKPDFDTIIKIADYFNVSIDYLFGRTEAKNQNHYILDNLVNNFYDLSFEEQTMMSTLIANLSMGFDANRYILKGETLNELCDIYEQIWFMQAAIPTLLCTKDGHKDNDIEFDLLSVTRTYNTRKRLAIECMDVWFEKCVELMYIKPQED